MNTITLRAQQQQLVSAEEEEEQYSEIGLAAILEKDESAHRGKLKKKVTEMKKAQTFTNLTY